MKLFKKLNLIILISFLVIRVFPQNNSNLKVVIDIPDYKSSLAIYSPDGKYIAFTSEDNFGIKLLELSSGKISTVNEEPASGWGMQWSSDSKAILFRAAKFVGDKRTDAIKYYNVETKLTSTALEYRSRLSSMPVWVRNSEKIALFVDNKLEYFITDIKAKNNFNLRDNTQTPILNKTTLFITNNEQSSGAKAENITSKEVIKIASSSVTNKIAYEILGGNLFISSLDGSEKIDLGTAHRPSFSADGKFLAYQVSTDDGHSFISSDIYIYNIIDNKSTKLKTGDKIAMNPNFSPDGNSILFEAIGEGKIYQLTINN